MLFLNEPSLQTELYSVQTIEALNTMINWIYIAEAFLKIVAMGFVLNKHSYLREPFNVFDFVIIICSIISWILEQQSDIDLKFISVFRALRALRPLRLISKD